MVCIILSKKKKAKERKNVLMLRIGNFIPPNDKNVQEVFYKFYYI
jgi:hypothetical protein